MTMLDRMRRHKAWLKWSLGIVVAAFILLYIPSFLSPPTVGAAPGDMLASVEGRTITVGTWQRAYQQQVMALQSQYGGAMNEQILQQLGIAQQVLQQLIDEEAMSVEADRVGLGVSDGELRERILRLPMLQLDGRFVGDERYRQFLAAQRPPLSPGDFERMLRRSLQAEKLERAVTGWVTVSEADVDAEYRRRNEKVQLELAVFTADRFREGLTPTDAEVEAHFAANQETYRVPDKRRVKYLAVNPEVLRATIAVTTADIEARYRENIAMYSTPEQVRASHILLKTEGKDEAAVRAEAERILAQVQAGGDFAALARQHSEDEGSQANGGDLDYFGRGAMVAAFEEAAWALEVGGTSDLVLSPFGFHIIRVTDKREATTRPLDDVRAQVEDQIKWERAQADASRLAVELEAEIDDPTDLDRIAAARGLPVGDSGLFSRDEPLAGLGFAPEVSAEAFRLEPGQVSGLLRTSQGFAFITVAEVKASYLPDLAEVRETVRDDVVRTQAVARARQRAEQVARATGSFTAAARAAGVEIKTTELVTRDTPLQDIGVSRAVDDAVFALEIGQKTGPIETNNAVVVARVTDRESVTDEQVAAGRDTLRAELLQQQRNAFFASYMTKAKTSMRIGFNETALDVILKR
ncbi:MAG TPA: peptidyl-prolyl cis-trans isomerase [Vicinamibacterales bacterium]|nr:peptidyl-prolyl cis-trans isomerase [Vicinamibacterales bacterium]